MASAARISVHTTLLDFLDEIRTRGGWGVLRVDARDSHKFEIETQAERHHFRLVDETHVVDDEAVFCVPQTTIEND